MDDYKEKYENLIEQLKKAKEEHGGYTFSSVIDKIVPELKESEDEKIRKEIIAVFKGKISYTSEEDIKKYIAWLEKKSETRSTDKVEPKFKVDDWCIDNEDDTIFQIVKVLDNTYTYKTNDGEEYSCTHYSLENDTRLWTIQDAKDGDVLAAYECYVIFKEIDDLNIKCYCTYHCMNNPMFFVNTLQNKTAFHPATKEQRDLLFQKMKEAGYEWDAEKKELKEIKQDPTDNVEPKFKVGDIISDGISEVEIVSIDKNMYNVTIGDIENDAHICNWVVYFKDQEKWKLVEYKSYNEENKKHPQPKQEWNEEDEEILKELVEEVKDQLDSVPSPDCMDKEDEKVLKQLNKWMNWLKSLKDRVQLQPKQEWSEEDEYQINTILHGLDLKRELHKKEGNQVEEKRYKTQYDWLKSLKPNNWKPSEDKKETKNKCPNYSEGYGCSTSPLKRCDTCPDYKLYNHWKPSKEQMEELEIAYKSYSKESKEYKVLKSLYNDFKNFES